MFAVPSKAVPPIVLAVASLVAVAALPVTLPVKAPINDVAVTDPVRLMVPEPLIVFEFTSRFPPS